MIITANEEKMKMIFHFLLAPWVYTAFESITTSEKKAKHQFHFLRMPWIYTPPHCFWIYISFLLHIYLLYITPLRNVVLFLFLLVLSSLESYREDDSLYMVILIKMILNHVLIFQEPEPIFPFSLEFLKQTLITMRRL